ncbi:TPA: restriction endonuclease subunit S [Enterobacter hormaechei subsp. xiangfangensis]
MVPKLRFGGFKEEWTMTLLSKLATKITDGTHDTPDTMSEGIPYLTAIHVKDGYIDYKNCYYLDKLTHSLIYKRCNPEKNDLLIVNIGAGTGTCALNTVDYEFSLKNVALVKPNKNKVYPFYLLQVQRKNAKKLFHELTSGGAQPFLSLKEIGKLKIPLCQYDEQTKIADFLSSVDDKITLLNQQYDLLCQYKKGMMQKIFSQEVRFNDENGEAFPEWNSCQLKDVATRVTRKNKENNQTILTISGRDGLVDQMTYFNKQIASKNVTGYYLISNGEFAYNKSYSQGYPMGAIKMLTNYDKGVVSTLYICFKLNEDQFNNFYQHYFESGLQNRSIEKVAQEGARNHGLLNIGVNDFFDIELQIPCLKEQIKVADFLSALDDKIAVKKAKLDKLKTWKQGLLQQMFV